MFARVGPWFCLLVVALTAGACDSGTTVPTDLTLDDLPPRYATVVCGAADQCLGPLIDIVLPNCESDIEALAEDSFVPVIREAIARGTVTYDGMAMAACLTALESASCSELDDPSTICDEALTGTAELGQPCLIDAECLGVAFCNRAAAACPGTCAALSGSGGSCTRDAECAEGLDCSSGSCVVSSGIGQRCTGSECELGQVCVPDAAGADGTCQPLDSVLTAGIGENCELDSDGPYCQEGLSCVVTSAMAGMIDAQCAAPVGAGAACHPGVPDPCPAGQYCAADVSSGIIDGVCEPLPAVGEPCAPALGPSTGRCGLGGRCVSGTCVRIGRLGDPCTSDAGCASNNCNAGTCAEGTAECSMCSDQDPRSDPGLCR